jgi:hypothetical protein
VTGQIDLYDESTSTIYDYKETSVYSFLLGMKQSWTQQLNCYAHLLRCHYYPVHNLVIFALLRDWNQRKAETEDDYPSCQFHVQPVTLWPAGDTREYLEERVRLHREARKLTDDDLPPCTEEERWARPASWAVKKKGVKRAQRVFTTEEEASELAEAKGYTVEYRPGQDVRCERYCKVAPWCNYYMRNVKGK